MTHRAIGWDSTDALIDYLQGIVLVDINNIDLFMTMYIKQSVFMGCFLNDFEGIKSSASLSSADLPAPPRDVDRVCSPSSLCPRT